MSAIPDLTERLRAAGHDERLATGPLYLEAADEIEWLRKAHIDAVQLEQGDTLVVFCPGSISERVAKHLTSAMEKYFPGTPIAILGDDLRLGVLRAAAPPP